MAIVKVGLNRPNASNLFEDDFIKNIEKNITTPEEVRKEYSLHNFPLDIESLLERLNISLVKKVLDNDISGMLISDNGHYTIVVEERHSENRQRFTIAHEIAHYFLHKNLQEKFEDVVFFRGTITNSMEFQANNFASELLMPKETFLQQIKKGKNKIEELARFFGVSSLAIRVRAKQLNLVGHGL